MKHFHRAARGKIGEDLAVRWLQERGFQIEERNWRPPKGWGAGEVDIVASRVLRLKAPEIWLIEVKSHVWNGRGESSPLIFPKQLLRQQASACLWRQRCPRAVVRTALLWFEPQSRQIQFIEKACYS